MALTAGTRLGHYDVTTLIGEGGMGQVWQATDTQLNRQVALKILPDAFASDPDRLARFTREAQILASLNHLNIAAIHGIEEAEGTRALVLELVEGPTLADRIRKGPIPLDEALPIAQQIAEALEAAHEAGVIHRDLKPANIKVREDGTVKVLDFGLAKALAGDALDADLSQSPTVTAAGTQKGVILGTAAYMSPEQARGKPLDKRTDIWSFGCVLFEMLTGRTAFSGETLSDTIANVLERQPQWETLPTATPTTIQTLLRRSLTKERSERIPDIGIARIEIDDARKVPAGERPNVSTAVLQVWQRPVPLLGCVAALLAITSLATWIIMQPEEPAPRQLARFVFEQAERIYIPESSLGLAISPDGQRVAYLTGDSATPRLQIRELDQLESATLVSEGRPFNPFFSPDSQWVGFYDFPTHALMKVSVHGGPTLKVCDLPGIQMRGATWGPDETIVFGMNGPGSGLWRVGAGGGEKPVPLTQVEDEANHRWPHMLSGGQAVLFTIRPSSGGASQLAVVSMEGGDPKDLNLTGSNPRYVPTGHLLYGVDGTLRAAHFDLDGLEVTSDPIPVVGAVGTQASGSASFSVARDGTLVYVPGGSGRGVGGEETRVLVWVTPAGLEERILSEPRAYRAPRISPDGTKLVVDVATRDVLINDFATETSKPFTVDPGSDAGPIWTPDGLRIIWQAVRDGGTGNLFWQAADGTGAEERLTTSINNQFPRTVSSDGLLVFTEGRDINTSQDIGMLSLTDEERETTWLVRTPFDERNPVLSPDGHWMAYTSDRTGVVEVYVKPFPNVDDEREQVSQGGGNWPTWAHNRNELFYRTAEGMMVVAYEAEPGFRPQSPALLFEETGIYTNLQRSYDVAPDGRFLVVKAGTSTTDNSKVGQIILIQNWFDELQRLVPVP